MLLDLAILNNATWCSAVVGAHGLRNSITDHFWSADGAVPLYYSNLVTRTAATGEAAQLARIAELAAAPPKPDWSVKDSFARLDLGPVGLHVLFDAQWYGLDAGSPVSHAAGCSIVPLETAADLERWERAWQIHSPAPGQRTFPPSLLDDPAITFLEARRNGQPIGGAIVNLSHGAVGLSNVFPPDDADLLRDCAACARDRNPDRAVVGYGSEVERAQLGFRNLGPLRVWIR